MANWILTANPERWPILQVLSEGRSIDSWTVSRHLDELAAGDNVAMWVVGRRAGVYALGTITGTPFATTTDRSWARDEDRGKRVSVVPIELDRLLLGTPLLRSDLAEDPRFARALVLRMPGGSNPFPVSAEEWSAIEVAASEAEGSPRPRTRNPNWTWDELILAMELYLRHRPHLIDDRHPEVVELSETLNSLPIHTARPDAERFRNPNGVAMKLANFARLDPEHAGRGLNAGSQLEVEVWDTYLDQPEELRRLADEIRSLSRTGGAPAAPEEDEDERPEGRLLFRRHRTYERDPRLTKRKKQQALRQHGRLACEVCGFDFGEAFGELGTGYIEAHHLVPLAEAGETKNRLADLALLCANCHRMAHRARPWATLDELKAARQATSGRST